MPVEIFELIIKSSLDGYGLHCYQGPMNFPVRNKPTAWDDYLLYMLY
jgi:hypothetical protein